MIESRCEKCETRYPGLGPDGLRKTVCDLCEQPVQQEQEQEEGQGSGLRPQCPPVPVVPITQNNHEVRDEEHLATNDDGPLLYRLIDSYEAGDLEPAEVQLGPEPPWLGKTARAILEDVRLLLGLRYAAGETRPLPYATTYAVKRGKARDPSAASKALRDLVGAGTLQQGETLHPLKHGNDGTKTYGPPPAGVVAIDIRSARQARRVA